MKRARYTRRCDRPPSGRGLAPWLPPLRTFVALRCGAAVRKRLRHRAEHLRGLDGGLRTVALEDFHLTVQFLGPTEEDEIHRIAQALERAAVDIPPLTLRYRGLGAFPTPERARVVWAGVEDETEPPALEPLVASVARELDTLGFEPERRRFHAHVTLGRLRRRPDPALVEAVSAAEGLDLGLEGVSELKLILSAPGRGPYHYTDLTTVDL